MQGRELGAGVPRQISPQPNDAGACMAIEDAAVLGRALENVDETTIEGALKRYERARSERTARVQIGSRGNEWLKQGGNADWVYGYDANSAPLGPL